MVGKLVEDQNVNASYMKTFELGNSCNAGVYSVIVSQGENLKTLRVIKR